MALVSTDVSEEHIVSIIMVRRISELGTTVAETSNRHTLQKMKALCFYETSAFFMVIAVKTSNITAITG
jgi:hypothetical protein